MGHHRLAVRNRECRRVLRDLQAFVDGEVDERTAWQLSRHLARCEDCFGDAESYRAIKDAVYRLRVRCDPLALSRLRAVVASLKDLHPTD